MKTAIQQLIEDVKHFEENGITPTTKGLLFLLNESLDEEKQQLEEAFYSDESNFEQYYNNKFEK